VTLYARSDLMSVSVPVTSGGCGKSHNRPVRNGVPAREFRLDCPGCEAFLKGGGRTVIVNTPPDKEHGIPGSQKRVADMDPCWGGSPESVPETPDEVQYTRKRNKLGAEELEWIRAIAAAKQAGLELPDEAKAMLSQRLPGFGVVDGEVICPQGHANAPGLKFCGECGSKMDVRGAVETPNTHLTQGLPEDSLSKLNISDLKSLCRQQGLPVGGKKADLVARLS
jgi:SAP domain